MPRKQFRAVVIGSSAGGIHALSKVLSSFPKAFPIPIIIVQHLHPQSKSQLASILQTKTELHVKEADEKETVEAGTVYIAPPNYHLLIEIDESLSLSIEERVNYARPAVDVLFDSAIDVYHDKIIGIILTGANNDGAQGLKRIKQAGGYAVVQDPETAEVESMPRAACEACPVDKVLPLAEIGPYVLQLVNHYYRSRKLH